MGKDETRDVFRPGRTGREFGDPLGECQSWQGWDEADRNGPSRVREGTD